MRTTLLLLTLFFSITLNAFEIPKDHCNVKCSNTTTDFKCVKFERVKIPDFVLFTVPGVSPIVGTNIPVRIRGIRTPRYRSRNRCERGKAMHMASFINQQLSRACRIHLKYVKRDMGMWRMVADIEYDGKSLAKELVKKGWTLYSENPRLINVNWCNDRV